MRYTEMMQEENSNADICGSMHSIEGALHNCDLIFPRVSHEELSLNFCLEAVFHRFYTAYVRSGLCWL